MTSIKQVLWTGPLERVDQPRKQRQLERKQRKLAARGRLRAIASSDVPAGSLMAEETLADIAAGSYAAVTAAAGQRPSRKERAAQSRLDRAWARARKA